MADAGSRAPSSPVDRRLTATLSPCDLTARATFELLRPLVLFGQTPEARPWQRGVSKRTLRRKVARFPATKALAQDRVAYESDGRRLREIVAPRRFPPRYPSPQPFLAPLDEVSWPPARRLAPCRARRASIGEGRQVDLFDLDLLASSA